MAGIAVPGLMNKGKVESASLELQSFCGRIAYLLGHVLVEWMLSDTPQSNQGIPSDAKFGMTEKFRRWLQLHPINCLKPVEAITISLSNVGASPHYDSQNDL
jgi:hypothetical protein